jgi:hypothetical protein
MWEVKSWSVIEAHLEMHGLELVNREVLEDLRSAEEYDKRLNDSIAHVNPN